MRNEKFRIDRMAASGGPQVWTLEVATDDGFTPLVVFMESDHLEQLTNELRSILEDEQS